MRPWGTEISAPAAGEVILVDDLYYNGKTIFLDHGQGLVTMYCHLSASLINEGEPVEQGDVLAWSVPPDEQPAHTCIGQSVLNGYRVDPQSMMAELFPNPKRRYFFDFLRCLMLRLRRSSWRWVRTLRLLANGLSESGTRVLLDCQQG